MREIPAVITLNIGFLMVVIPRVCAGELMTERFAGGAPCKEGSCHDWWRVISLWSIHSECQKAIVSDMISHLWASMVYVESWYMWYRNDGSWWFSGSFYFESENCCKLTIPNTHVRVVYRCHDTSSFLLSWNLIGRFTISTVAMTRNMKGLQLTWITIPMKFMKPRTTSGRSDEHLTDSDKKRRSQRGHSVRWQQVGWNADNPHRYSSTIAIGRAVQPPNTTMTIATMVHQST